MKKKKTKKLFRLIPSILLFIVVFIPVSGYFLINADGPKPLLAPPSQPAATMMSLLPSPLGVADMERIIPDKLTGDWNYKTNYSGEGTLTMMFDKPGNHRVVINVIDKRSPEMAGYAVTPENFSYTESGIPWELSETQYNRAPAMKGSYMVDNARMGELIAYPHDRFLVIAFILGENDNIVKMQDLLNILEF
ncbi:MAG: hypothetical protein K0A89_12695 [ANME-2 cluster archaeon]|nr:hypothetical protein [ANME-2 cluster archaeon]